MSSQNSFSGLKPNKKECEVAGTCVKKGVKVALCGMKNINLKKTVKILGVHYSYNKKLKMKRISKMIYR